MSRFVRLAGAEYRAWWNERYAPSRPVLDDFGFWQRGRSMVWIASRDVEPGNVEPVEGVGIPFLRVGNVWKPTSIGMVHVGEWATRNVVELDDDAQLIAYLRRERVAWPDPDPSLRGELRGFVIVRAAGIPLGCGIAREGALDSAIPKGRRVEALDPPVRPSDC